MFILVQVVCACAGSGRVPQRVVVHDAAQLLAALQPANAGRHIVVARGEYRVDGPLQVPDGATLEGAGVMRIGADGIPEGFAPGTETTLRASPGLQGQILTLGQDSVLRGLQIIDTEVRSSQREPRRGNVVYVASRAPGDVISASVFECEIVNPHAPGFSDDGPDGRGIVVLTLNPNLGAPPLAHDGARVELTVARSIVRAHRGAVVFAANFAAHGNVALKLEGNRFEGNMAIGAGVSRPDLVSGAHMQVTSRGNLYMGAGGKIPGWILFGGSSAPHFAQAGVAGASRATLWLDSVDDRIEDFRWAIHAAAARRLGADSSPLSDNRVELNLLGTRIRTAGDDAVDLVLQGTLSEVTQYKGFAESPAGDRNLLRVQMRGVIGSGERANRYAHVAGPVLPQNMGSGNRLEIAGDPAEFVDTNRGIEPLPGGEFFVGDR